MAYSSTRIFRLVLFFLILSSLLVMRLFYLQIIQGQQLALEGLNIRVQGLPVEIARGEILDCNRLPLTNTTQQYSLVVFPGQVEHTPLPLLRKLNAIVSLPSEQLEYFLQGNHTSEYPFRLAKDISSDTAKKINDLHIPGIIAIAEKNRYGQGMLASHILGYINSADNKGVSGIEGMYDELLRGNQPEYVAAIVDASQQIIPGLGYKRLKLSASNNETNIVLTIDKQIQQKVENCMDRTIVKGAVVVMRPSTGEILAMASRPGFDANNLSRYLEQSSAPLLNRAISAYQPGSVFKLVVAAAALENKTVKMNDVLFDAGYIDVNNVRFQGWDYGETPKGYLTITEAMAHSSNPVFIEVALKLGAEKLIAMAAKFGYGSRTNLGFLGESEGNLPAADQLYPGDLANLAIGQGFCEATPVQVAQTVATIVNDGLKIEPYIVSLLTTPDGTIVKKFQAHPGIRVISRQTAERLRNMMLAVTQYGTGQAAYVEVFGSAGKTGSAETGRTSTNGKGINHAWFAGFTPFEHPKYVIVVFVEEGMSGSNVAAPIFRDIATEILKN
ncbi:Stage V sporulation protein D [Sporomusa ovata DSM 2662]|uniref:Cell division protein FtsI [Peptidoglycan synthetase] n=1 Tax=Sporomusa ovata TaxID=2378 RepID=A0A0U1L4L1_9FIRM|nr:penicillin-binding transpeptidase domain-containing protein [Sporomusa ovata]EQB25478.1 stage V sporulation protein D [Sporomusa ovata DSM 2662]CQR74043.1 Cell division protein FtsI [Peptidoglycan synthetase] [Sporomusa ovata]